MKRSAKVGNERNFQPSENMIFEQSLEGGKESRLVNSHLGGEHPRQREEGG